MDSCRRCRVHVSIVRGTEPSSTHLISRREVGLDRRWNLSAAARAVCRVEDVPIHHYSITPGPVNRVFCSDSTDILTGRLFKHLTTHHIEREELPFLGTMF
ncbi:hypothetical protein LINPERPRIM_LOCUS1758 [Linum perenne]